MTDIRLLDDKYDKEWTILIFSVCGLDYEALREERLTREILEPHLGKIIEEIFNSMAENIENDSINYSGDFKYVDGILIGFQILGIFILKTGAYLPDIVKHAILFSTTWEYDRMRGWSKHFEEDRKENLKKFREAILDHEKGRKIKISF